MPSYLTNKYKDLMLNGDIDPIADTIKIMACNQFTVNVATQDFINSVSSNQITATGYTAGGLTLTSKVITRDNTDNRVYFDFANPTWTITGTMTAQTFVIYKDTGTPATSPIIAIIDTGAPQSRTDADFVLQLNTKGIFGI